MPAQVNIQPEPFEFETESEWEGETLAPQMLQVRARILWPALGFPAVIAPRRPPTESAMLDADATRCICVGRVAGRNRSPGLVRSRSTMIFWSATRTIVWKCEPVSPRSPDSANFLICE